VHQELFRRIELMMATQMQRVGNALAPLVEATTWAS
jgi:hypothetical protein